VLHLLLVKPFPKAFKSQGHTMTPQRSDKEGALSVARRLERGDRIKEIISKTKLGCKTNDNDVLTLTKFSDQPSKCGTNEQRNDSNS